MTTHKIRAQYYFRPSKKGLLAWDIRRLISLSQKFPIKNIPVDSIRELDEAFWFDHQMANHKTPTCRRIAEHIKLIETTNLEFPIILSKNGQLMDGMHRVVKALINDHQTIKAVQFTTDPEPDYVNVNPDELPYD